jgi:hypothetical protein
MNEPVEDILEHLVTLLTSAHESAWQSTVQELLAEVEATLGDDVRYQHVLRRLLRLYSGGMSSFGDLVLQANGDVRPEHPEFALARQRLYDVACDQLR